MAIALTIGLQKADCLKGKEIPCFAGFCIFSLDVVLTISSVVLAILILTSVIPLPPTAAYGLFAGAGAILIADVVAICSKKNQNKADSE